MPTSLYVDRFESQSQFDPPGFWLLTFSNFVISRPRLYKKLGNGRKEFQARHVIEFSGAHNICLDKLSRKLHTDWYVTGYN